MISRPNRLWTITLVFVLSCTGDEPSSDPSECIAGEYCLGSLECVDGLCVEPGESETGDGDPGDGDPGDGDGDCEPGTESCACDLGEACDDGLSCVGGVCVAVGGCGDGVIDVGEECDDGNEIDTDTCLSTCVDASCGDGFVGPGEGCDDGNEIDDDDCTNDCKLSSCGDGEVQEGEACDDGNLDDGDDCLSTCVDASCGDGFVWVGQEECDDGDADNTDACLETCVDASCGDGFVGPGEGCDDGNEVNDDSCDNMCAPGSCGDGITQPGEDCDDGNDVDEDACLSSCVSASCGDGIVWAEVEECDDQNDVSIDGCEPGCVATEIELYTAYQHTCMLLVEDKSVHCWGTAAEGAIGNGTSQVHLGDDPDELPTPALDLGGPVEALALGSNFGCAVLENGELRCWGGGTGGRLGHGGNEVIGDEPGELPPPATDVGGTITQLSLGATHACVVLDGGNLRCWGYGDRGQLGHGNTQNLGDEPGEMPPPDVNVGAPVAQVATGTRHTCAMLVGGPIRCWGDNTYGQLGVGHTDDIGDDPGEMPPANVNYGLGFPVQLAASNDATCVLLGNGDLRCWGHNGYSELGQGHGDDIGDGPGEMPPANTDVGGTVVDFAMGPNVCALLDDDALRCWGMGESGLNGNESTQYIGGQPWDMPPADVDVGGPVKQLAHGHGARHRCVVLANGSPRCWGYNGRGQLGQGNTSSIGDQPGSMPPPPVPVF